MTWTSGYPTRTMIIRKEESPTSLLDEKLKIQQARIKPPFHYYQLAVLHAFSFNYNIILHHLTCILEDRISALAEWNFTSERKQVLISHAQNQHSERIQAWKDEFWENRKGAQHKFHGYDAKCKRLFILTQSNMNKHNQNEFDFTDLKKLEIFCITGPN